MSIGSKESLHNGSGISDVSFSTEFSLYSFTNGTELSFLSR